MSADVVIVGGGVGGCALAVRLATAGLEVTVLKRDPAYRDMVRGEAMLPWGFQEATALGIADTILGADGATVVTRMIPYDESLTVEQAQRVGRDLTSAAAGSPGVTGVGHPELREALSQAATKAGATIVRDAQRTTVHPGTQPTVTYTVDGVEKTLRTRLAIGADGKTSMTRTTADVDFITTAPRVQLTGMLVDDGGTWDRQVTSIAVDGRNQYIVIPRADNKLRLYVGRSTDDPEPLKGPDRIERFMEAYRTKIFPDHDQLAAATPLGPCASFPMNDAWTDTPVVPGLALIGDAAG